MKSMFDKALTLQEKRLLTNNLFPNIKQKQVESKMKFFGLERFAMEHWVGSHPSIMPCDVAGDLAGNLTAWNQSGGANESVFVWKMAPHASFRPAKYWSPLSDANVDLIMSHKNLRMREYFLFPGQLFKWMYLYNEIPQLGSWALQWYPDRVEWRQRVKLWGIKVLDSIIPKP
jgi:hypothetical protein